MLLFAILYYSLYGRFLGTFLGQIFLKSALGNDWLNKDLFRIGASSLVEDIEHRLGK